MSPKFLICTITYLTINYPDQHKYFNLHTRKMYLYDLKSKLKILEHLIFIFHTNCVEFKMVRCRIEF